MLRPLGYALLLVQSIAPSIGLAVPRIALAAPRIEVRDAGAFIVDDTAELAITPTLSFDHRASSTAPGSVHALPISWHRDPADGGATAEVVTPDGAFAATLHLSRNDNDAAVLLTIEGGWRHPTWVHLSAIDLPFAADGESVIGRDLQPSTANPAYLERFNPKWITLERAHAPFAQLMLDDTVDGVIVQRTRGHVQLRVELDSAEARPFMHDAQCNLHWRDPNRHIGMATRLRTVDEHVSARIALWFTPTVRLVKSFFPDGRRAALVITDHADQTSARTLAALAHGRSDGGGTGGLIGHHIPITKALFAHGRDRPQLENPQVIALADELEHAGSEIVPHSATPVRDDRSTTSAALDQFERWNAITWIDHQPETNCEAFGDQGFHTGGRFGIADILAAHQYRYVWAEDDVPAGELNLLEPSRLDHRAPTLWPLGRLDYGGPNGLWMFRSQWAFVDAKRFYAMYGPSQLDRLEHERGLTIAHTYLETYHPQGTVFGARNLIVPVDPKRDRPGGTGAVELDPRFEVLLAALETRVARGTLWVATLGALGDRLRAMEGVTISLRRDGSAILHAPQPVTGATFVVAQPNMKVELDARPPRGARTEDQMTTFWADLPAGDTHLTMTSPIQPPSPTPTTAPVEIH